MSEQLIFKTGKKLKTRKLLEQSSYSVALAKEHFAALGEVGLDQQFIDNTHNLVEEVIDLEGLQESAKDNIGLATEQVYDQITAGKNWLKKAKLKAKRAFRLNQAVYDDFMAVPFVRFSVSELISAMSKMIELQRKYDADLQRFKGGTVFADEGSKILKELQQIDSKQELTKTDLPDASKELYLNQGKLYYNLKDINDMGQEAFIHEPLTARKFNMSILKR
jgi:Tat protein secretion system quality control protein TatD with DNase activity